MDEENREDTVADALRPILEEGDAYSVFCHEGEIHVKEADTSVCAVTHPRLYGRLLSLSAQLDNAGAGYSRLPTLAILWTRTSRNLNNSRTARGKSDIIMINNRWDKPKPSRNLSRQVAHNCGQPFPPAKR